MTLDSIENNNIETSGLSLEGKLGDMHKTFKSGLVADDGIFAETSAYDGSLAQLSNDNILLTSFGKATAIDTVKNMYYGDNGLGLKEIHGWGINKQYEYANIKQHAGYAAEVISTHLENMESRLYNKGTRTIRVDDMSDSLRNQFGDKFKAKNDPYVDKVRIKADGTYETIQTKFVGKDGADCYKRLKSPKFDKYLEDGKVDKLEVPKDYYDDIKASVKADRKSLQAQIDKLKADGKTEEAAKAQNRLDKINKLDEKLEKSMLTSDDAVLSVPNPKACTAKLLTKQSHKAGMKQAGEAAKLTAIVSTGENLYKLVNDEISGTEAALNIAKETTMAAGVGYGSGFISEITGSSIPVTLITFGVTSYSDIRGFAEGELSGKELAYNIGETVFGMAGGVVGSTVLGPVGGIAGSYIADQVYTMSIDFVADHIDDIAKIGSEVNEALDKAGEVAEDVKDAVSDGIDYVSDKAVEVKDAAAEKIDDIVDSAEETIDDVKEFVSDTIDDVKEKMGEAKEAAADTLGKTKDTLVGLFK